MAEQKYPIGEMVHPERGRMSVDDTLQTLHWHARHHIAHIDMLRKQKGWRASVGHRGML